MTMIARLLHMVSLCAIRSTACLMVALGLTGCGGGGGGGGPGGAPSSAASFETDEYARSPGLALIDAAPAYARGATGRGATVAVIDTGVDLDHPELSGAISPASIDIVSGSTRFLDDDDGHGTAVAGVIAGRKNGQLAHGVAFEADILAIRADALGSCTGGCAFAESDVATATDYAVTNNARVINYSLGGGSSIGTRLKSALAAAANAGTILVLAAGNNGSDGPIFPAAAADDGAIRGSAIAVGSVDADGRISTFSNRAGDAADVFMVAPGERIVTARAGGGGTVVSGTSFAAPHVSGAAALLLGRSPFLSAEEVVELLLSTATDLGDPGVDPIYGHGLLDLAEALRPQGTLAVPLGAQSSEEKIALAGSGLALGPAVGLPADLPPLVALDQFGRPYRVALDAMIDRRRNAVDLQRRLAPPTPSAGSSLGGPGGNRSTFRVTGETRREQPWRAWADDTDVANGFDLRFASDQGLELAVVTGGAVLGEDEAMRHTDGLLTVSHFAPSHALMPGDVMRLRQAVGGGWSFGLVAGREDGQDVGDDRVAAADLAFRARSGGGLKLGFGWLEEPDGPFDSRGSGALAIGEARTSFLSVAGSLPLLEDWALFGRAAWGRTTVEDRPGLLDDVSTLESIGAAAGLARHRLLNDTDRLTIAIAQPLRVESGRALLDRPVGRSADGRILRERTSIDLEPDGREVAFEAGYQTSLSSQSALSFNWLTRLQPDHAREAEPWHGMIVTLRHRL